MAEFPGTRKRWISGSFLIAAVVMLVLGETVLAKSLQGRTFIYYWLTCFSLTGLAALTAIIEFFAVRRQARKQQTEIIKKVFGEIIDGKHNRKRPS